ncbi:Uncharacterised protein [Neisseria meningitidis]|nr:Uncharacterised protein [Neisseria meningitidis]
MYSGLTKTSTALLYCLRLAALSYTVFDRCFL